MPNHVHFIAQSIEGIDFAAVVRDFKRHTSSRLFEQLQRDHRAGRIEYFRRAAQFYGQKSAFKIWQDGYHPEEIHTEAFFQQKLNYLHDNPVRKGYVAHPWEWLYSSARYYADYETELGVLQVDFVEW